MLVKCISQGPIYQLCWPCYCPFLGPCYQLSCLLYGTLQAPAAEAPELTTSIAPVAAPRIAHDAGRHPPIQRSYSAQEGTIARVI